MTSTTKSKKELIDFLWEWAEKNGDWSKALISKIVETENSLSSEDRESIFNYFLQSIGLCTANLPNVAISKPNYSPTSKQIELAELSNVTGVNRLAQNQTITFSNNLTVIYGENGTGKTGYSRILKHLGFSYDPKNILHSNIYGSAEPMSAVIKFTTDKEAKTFEWDGTNKDIDLQNVSVFNNNCVQLTLIDRELIVSPIGFHLFSLVTSELGELNTLANKKIEDFSTTFTWTDRLNAETPQQKFISELSETSSEQELIELSMFTAIHEQELIDKNTERSNLNKTLLEIEINNLTLIKNELEDVISKIQLAQKLLNNESWQSLIKYNNELAILENENQIGIKEIADINGIQFYKTTEFQTFIKSAENYIKASEKSDYPTADDLCIYCKQPLETSANELLKSYRSLLNDQIHEQLNRLKEDKTKLINSVNSVDAHIIFNQPVFGIDGDGKPVQSPIIVEYNSGLTALKTAFTTDNLNNDSLFVFNYERFMTFFTNEKESVCLHLNEKISLSENTSTKEIELKNIIFELVDRKLFSQKLEEIKTSIENRKTVKKLRSKLSSFSTREISLKTSEAREQLVEQNFNQLFHEELKAFRKPDLEIDVSFETSKGKSKISKRMNAQYELAEILSEGEQKTIALAAFLTELQLDNMKAPVIFDDPVNSLDHKIIDEVAKRLMKLSKERQVIVFTHSVLLFNSFLHFNKQPSYKNLSCKSYNSKNEFSETGFIIEAEEEINKVKTYTTKINKLLNNSAPNRLEAEVVAEGYGYLRSVIELLVEHQIFNGTVKRYQKNVALTNFLKVNGMLIDTHKDKLNEIFEKCCGYIVGHSNPIEIHNTPTIQELKIDYEEFEKIKSGFPSQ